MKDQYIWQPAAGTGSVVHIIDHEILHHLSLGGPQLNGQAQFTA